MTGRVTPCMKCSKAVPVACRSGGYTVEARDGKAHLVKDGVLACANAPEEPEEIIERLAAKVEELKTVLREHGIEYVDS